MRQFHFISGLPRSGSTLLAAVLRQNPVIEANMSSPVGAIFGDMQRAISNSNEASVFLTDEIRARYLRSVLECYYKYRLIAFDTNRSWTSKLPTLVKLFPDCRMICMVRNVAAIVNSIEGLIRRNPYELSGIFSYEPGSTVFSRSAGLCAPGGMIGFSLNSLREAFYGEHADRLLLIEYKALCCDPGRIIRSIYKWLGLEPFAHDYENVETPPHVAEFDARLGTPGLHAVARKIRLLESKRIIPPDLWNSFETPFWRQSNPQEVPVIMYDVEKQNGKTPPRGSGHHAEAAAMLLS